MGCSVYVVCYVTKRENKNEKEKNETNKGEALSCGSKTTPLMPPFGSQNPYSTTMVDTTPRKVDGAAKGRKQREEKRKRNNEWGERRETLRRETNQDREYRSPGRHKLAAWRVQSKVTSSESPFKMEVRNQGEGDEGKGENGASVIYK